jgi:SAM-dependent methyltransferase
LAEHLNLYQRAVYYDIIFDRDVRREVDFMLAVAVLYSGQQPTSVLDIACGPGYHAREFARRGLRTIGSDLQPEMIAFARQKDESEGLPSKGLAAEWLVADMRQFQLKDPVDLAFIAFDGLDALQSNTDVIQHLRSVANNLTSGGIYLIDLSHPKDVNHFYYFPFHYEGERDNTRVEIDWGLNQPRYDLITNLARVELEMRITTAEGQEIQVQDEAIERLFLPQEILLLAEISGIFKVVGWYGDYDLNTPFDAPEAKRMVAVLQKKEA